MKKTREEYFALIKGLRMGGMELHFGALLGKANEAERARIEHDVEQIQKVMMRRVKKYAAIKTIQDPEQRREAELTLRCDAAAAYVAVHKVYAEMKVIRPRTVIGAAARRYIAAQERKIYGVH